MKEITKQWKAIEKRLFKPHLGHSKFKEKETAKFSGKANEVGKKPRV
jgi:hypothetical protein